MTRGSARVLLWTLLGGALLLGAVWWLRARGSAPEATGTQEPPLPGLSASAAAGTYALYFPGRDGRLHAEARSFPETAVESPRAAVRSLVEALLAGPENAALGPPMPAGTTLAAVDLGPENVAYIDLASAEQNPPPSGSLREMLAVYSLVDTVLLNVPDVRGVVLLWNGVQRPSFAGHLDTAHPLESKLDLVAALP